MRPTILMSSIEYVSLQNRKNKIMNSPFTREQQAFARSVERLAKANERIADALEKKNENVIHPWVFAMHGECDCGTGNSVKICASKKEALDMLEKHYQSMLEVYHIEEENIEWCENEPRHGMYNDMDIWKSEKTYSIFKGEFCDDFVHAWVQEAE